MRRLKITAIGCIGAMLAACETYAEDHQRIEHTAASLVGQPISVAMDRFGVPSGTTATPDGTIYIWRTSVHYPSLDMDEPLSCEVRIFANKEGLVRRWQKDGTNYGCQALARSIK